MNRFYCHYEKWEDYRFGMYENVMKDREEEYRDKAINLLSDRIETDKAMRRVISEWPIATKVNLSNLDCNRRAWLGQAACYIQCGTPEYLTREAWGLMLKDDQITANRIAESIIKEWEEHNEYNGGLFC